MPLIETLYLINFVDFLKKIIILYIIKNLTKLRQKFMFFCVYTVHNVTPHSDI